MHKLESKLADAKTTIQHLVVIRSDLEQEIKVKANSIFVDREQCQGIRRTFPYQTPPMP